MNWPIIIRLTILGITILVFAIFVFYYRAPISNTQIRNTTQSRQLLTDDQAIVLVKSLPEVRKYMDKTKEATQSGVYYGPAAVEIDSDRTDKDLVTVHVYQYMQPPQQNFGMDQSFNYYTFDRKTKSLKCEFATYDTKGNFIGIGNEYPCN